MKPVDAHCHLNFEQFDRDREELINRLSQSMEFIAVPGVNLETNKEVLSLEEKHPEFVVANLGLHPTYTDSFSDINHIKKQIREKKPAAIGEIGLDHHHVTDNELRKDQREVFEELLKLAQEMSKPVAVHSREAEKKTVELLKKYDIPEIFLHCFNGPSELAERAASIGMKIGVTTQVLYSGRVQEIVKTLDLDSMVLETDSPYLYQGERNDPSNISESVEKIAEIKDTSKKEVIEKTTTNASSIHKEHQSL